MDSATDMIAYQQNNATLGFFASTMFDDWSG
jgi:hypothetical protein